MGNICFSVPGENKSFVQIVNYLEKWFIFSFTGFCFLFYIKCFVLLFAFLFSVINTPVESFYLNVKVLVKKLSFLNGSV